eukprot:TRINITY_DN8325_c0_g1_i1.p1 TRINITY_DN8325_c0_g1~~TRINITY_DN8325_c0_g1_i1.p1  ORF type:complete len:373 (-),score=80.19 TRINITY_DN8325_c0_g1_i1:131-1249(-)
MDLATFSEAEFAPELGSFLAGILVASYAQAALLSGTLALFVVAAHIARQKPKARGDDLRGLARGREHMLVVGHRGASHEAPENTLASIKLAKEHGAVGVEFDIQRSKDGKIFLLHDDTLRRTASPACPDVLLDGGRMSAEEYDRLLDADVSTLSYCDFIQHVDVGSWKHGAFAEERPCLMIDAMKQLPEGHFALCEVKGGDFATARDVVNLVKTEKWTADKLVFIGFDFELMVEMKRLLVENGCEAIQVISIKDAYSEDAAKKHVCEAKRAGLDGVDFEADTGVVTQDVVNLAKAFGLHVGVWVWTGHLPDGGDTPQVAKVFNDRGITFFTSDLPPMVGSWASSRMVASRPEAGKMPHFFSVWSHFGAMPLW